MAKHVVVVLSEPFEGQDEAFNDWYENTHIDEVLTSAGVDSGQRFELTAEEGIKSPHKYLAFYEVCLLYTSPSPRDRQKSRMPSSA